MTAWERLEEWRERLEEACASAGREPGSVRLMGACKKVPPERLREFVEAGLTLLGENRVQEARVKVPVLSGGVEWHFIGGLQRNKVKEAVRLFDCIHSIDGVELGEEVSKRAVEAGRVVRVMVEVNVAGEASKHGVPPDVVEPLALALNGMPSLEVVGLMSVPPAVEDPEKARPYFARLRECKKVVESNTGLVLPELSMGMTHDFRQAVAEGATIVRIGTGLFGAREGHGAADA